MKSDVVPVQVVGITPTDNQGVAILLGNTEKVFVITVDAYVGRAIAMSLRGEKNERPLTHELIGLIFEAFSISLDRVIINDLRSNTYFARLILHAENEVHKKIIEIDARPSDCLALALASQRPILVSREVWDEVEDASELLEKMKQAQQEEEQDPPDEPSFGEDIK
ncbi:MAG: bifunctional nuclease family protein [Verrucomicrobium sp.]|nr:bifunctional nuclease family protein [Verrucomicrobium sp.]